MKKIIYATGILAAVALSFSACQKEQEINEEPQSGKLVTVSFTAEKAGIETRTGIAAEGSSTVSYEWTEEDANNLKLFTVSNTDSGETLTQVSNPVVSVTATKLTISAQVEANATYTFRAIIAGAWTSDGIKPKISDRQSPSSTDYDPNADVLVSNDVDVTVGESETTTGELPMAFERKVVINKMTLLNMTAGEKVSKVEISSNKNLAGTLTDEDAITTITIEYDNAEVPEGGFPVYFVATPNTSVSLTVTVVTDKHTYSKSFGEGKFINLTLGKFTKFAVALEKYYVKVSSTNDLANGVYLIVYEDGNVAFNGGLETLDAESNTIGVSIEDGKIESNSTTDAAAFTISIDNGTILSNSGQYIGQNTDANGLATSTSALNNTISISNGYAEIVSNGGAHLRYNNASNQTRFRYFKSATYTSQKAIALYLLEGSGTAPLNETLTVTPASTNPETVSYEGGVMNYTVTTGNISSWTATSDNEAFVVENVNGGFKVTVAANESTSPRSATITVTGGSKTETISIVQEAAPAQIQAISIAEFLTKQVNTTDWYQLTGEITSITGPSYGNLYIKDSTGSVYVYGLTSTQQSSNNQSFSSLDLQVGDILTLNTLRSEHQGTAQAGGSIPAYYVSHRKAPSLTVSPTTLSFDATGGSALITATAANFGGTVTISASSDESHFSVDVNGNSITVTAPANSGTEAINGMLTIVATDGVDSKNATVELTQNKPATPAEDGDILWQEDFTGYETTMPSSATGTHVYEGSTVTYTLTNGGSETKVYNENLAGGTKPELLVGKTTGSFKITGIPTGTASIITLSYRANNDNCTVTPSTGVTITNSSYASNIKTVVFSVTSGTESFDLDINNTKSSNTRVDDFMLIVGEPPAPTLSSIAVSGQMSSFTVGDTFDFGGTVTATYSNGTTADVTSSASFSGYNMSAAGRQTVNVSYTENDVTKTTSYSITVSEEGTPNPTTVKLTVGTNGGTTWNNGEKTSSASVGDVTFTALGSGGNEGKYYSSDNSWRFYTASTSGVKISVPDHRITSVVIKWKTGAPVTPSGFTASGSSSPTTYTATGSVSEVSFVRNNEKNLFIQEITVTYE